MPRCPSLALLIAALPFAALAPAQAETNRSVDSTHLPVIQRNDYTLDVPADRLDTATRDRVLAWFEAIRLGYGDRIGIDASATENDEASPLIAALAGRFGLLVSRGAPVTAGAIAPGSLRIVISRSSASVPDCPDWRQLSQPNFTSSTTSNYGCGIASTMAAMIANPEELVHGAQGDAGDAQTAIKAIHDWRAADSTAKSGLKVESIKGSGQ
ncbi:MAG: hypothetical protein JWR77_1170 [Rhizorhabdus sp.]|nr:hypothetical protein [Rhizorhabdus sp.]